LKSAKAAGKISIHASARDATGVALPTKIDLIISIHASARDATDFSVLMPDMIFISIHASARDATPRYYYNNYGRIYFNPRIREGCDNDVS